MSIPSNLVADTSPVAGLTRRRLPFLPVFAQSMAAIAPAGTSAVTPLFVIMASSGTASLVSFALALIAVLAIAQCIRPLAQRISVVGGLYSYVAQAFGPRVALPTAWSAIIGYGAVSMAGLLAVGLYLSHIAVSVGMSGTVSLVGVGVVAAAAAIVTVLLIRGVTVSAAATLATELFAVVVLGGLMAWLGFSHRSADWSHVFAPTVDSRSLGLNIVLAISAFVGFESATTLSAEARKPFLTVPRTVRWTPVVAGGIYLLAVVSQSLALYDAPDGIRNSTTPLSALFDSDGAQLAAVVLDVGVATSFFACTLASVNALVRVLFCLARERAAPAAMGRAHPRFHTPAVAVAAAMVAVVLGPLVFLLAGGSPEDGIRDFLTLSALGYVGSYLTACLAAPALLRRIRERSWHVTALGVITAVALGAVLVYSVIAGVGGSVLFAVYFGSMAVAMVSVIIVLRRDPARLSDVGVFDETTRDDVLLPTALR